MPWVVHWRQPPDAEGYAGRRRGPDNTVHRSACAGPPLEREFQQLRQRTLRQPSFPLSPILRTRPRPRTPHRLHAARSSQGTPSDRGGETSRGQRRMLTQLRFQTETHGRGSRRSARARCRDRRRLSTRSSLARAVASLGAGSSNPASEPHDADGHLVPRAAHIRKVYPRNQNPPGKPEAERRRMLRRGTSRARWRSS
jgi:hypothetical protein